MYLRALRGYEIAIEPQNIPSYRPAINTIWGLGALLWSQGHLADARKYYQRAYTDLKELLRPSHKDVQSLQNTLLDQSPAIEGESMLTVGAEMPTPTPTPAPTQARTSRRREVLKRVLGIRSKYKTYS